MVGVLYLFHYFAFFSHCIMACRQMHARYIPEPLECLLFYFFIICSSGFILYSLQIWLELARLGLFFLVCLFLFCIFYYS
ncbi:hypothetical protein HDV62DRAFT_375141 [Trichoderma sp. SZMC 28011]